jgi:hypothetical protein
MYCRVWACNSVCSGVWVNWAIVPMRSPPCVHQHHIVLLYSICLSSLCWCQQWSHVAYACRTTWGTQCSYQRTSVSRCDDASCTLAFGGRLRVQIGTEIYMQVKKKKKKKKKKKNLDTCLVSCSAHYRRKTKWSHNDSSSSFGDVPCTRSTPINIWFMLCGQTEIGVDMVSLHDTQVHFSGYLMDNRS